MSTLDSESAVTEKRCRAAERSVALLAGRRRLSPPRGALDNAAMRVIAGKLRGSILAAPPGRQTRPITDRVKESLFNVLGHRLGMPGVLPDIAVLDLFAGSGALGIECLSRGAGSCLFVESDRRTLRVLRANLDKLGLGDVARVATENAWTVRIPPAAPDGYGLIFVDPPYREVADAQRTIDLLERAGVRLSAEGLLVFRCSRLVRFSIEPVRSLRCVDERTFGTMRVLQLQRSD
jgi:16S rRNA (guanine966-N2)-methyltransferase